MGAGSRFISEFSSGVGRGELCLSQQVLDRVRQDVSAQSDSHWHLHEQGQMFEESAQMGAALADQGNSLVVCGIGGSGLGVRAFSQWLLPVSQGSRVEVLDHVDPAYLQEWFGSVDLKACVFCVTSKSGKTIETLSQWMSIHSILRSQGLSEKDIQKKVVVISNPGANPLTDWARDAGYACAQIPLNVGGRFSVLSPVGLIPLAFLGCDVQDVRRGISDEAQYFEAGLKDPTSCHTAYQSALQDAAVLTEACLTQHFEQWVLMSYSKKFFGFTLWAAQLIAESLGKQTSTGQHIGIIPLPAQGVTDQHSYLQYILEGPKKSLTSFFEFPFAQHLKVGDVPPGAKDELWSILKHKTYAKLHQTECDGTRFACDEKSRPYQRVCFKDVSLYATVRWVTYFQQLIGCMGLMMGINPYDQPGVEIGKIETLKRLKQHG